MAVTKLTTDLDVIQTLAQKPNTADGLTYQQLQAKFDEAGNDIKTYINDTLTVAIDTLDTANVKLTGNQTVAGIKTFSSSPIVPAPTTDLQVTTKKYVDDLYKPISPNINIHSLLDYTDLADAIATIGTDNAVLYVPTKATAYDVSANVVIPSNIQLVFNIGSVLKPASGVSITGTNTNIQAGLYQIFDLLAGGTIAGTWNIKEIYVEWFGAVNDKSTDNTNAISDCISFSILNKCKIKFQKGIYNVNTAITKALSSIDVIIEGDGKSENLYGGTTILWKGGAGYLFTFTGTRNIIFKNINICGYDSVSDSNVFTVGSRAIKTDGSINLQNCCVSGFEYLVDYNGGFYHKFENCCFKYFKYGFKSFNANNLIFDKCKSTDFEYFCTVTGGSGPVVVNMCSFEKFVSTLFTADSGSYPAISFTDNYVENYPSETPPTGITGLYNNALGIFGFSIVSCVSNTIFLRGIRRFIYSNSLTLNVVSNGNILLYAPATSTTQYYIYDANIETLNCNDVAYDILTETTGSYTPAYINSITVKKPGSSKIYNPFTKTISNKDSASTTNRPTDFLYNGYMMFDTTVGKPIWRNGTKWIYADGTDA